MKKFFLGDNLIFKIRLNGRNIYKAPPDIEVDFQKQLYLKDQIQVTFNDIFTFTRLGKAWLVKDTGIEEYLNNIPRFKSGLLLEEQSTNLSSRSYILPMESNNNSPRPTKMVPEGYFIPVYSEISPSLPSSAFYYYNITPELYNKDLKISWYTHNEIGITSSILESFNNINLTQDSIPTNKLINQFFTYQVTKRYFERYYLSFKTLVNPQIPPILKLNLNIPDINTRGFWGWQVEKDIITSLIPTEGTIITRPKEYLEVIPSISKIEGVWDSTLNVEVENNKLKITGSGSIQTLNIWINK